MSNKRKAPAGDQRIHVRGIRREPVDVKKLSRALIALAMAQAQAEADAQTAHEKQMVEEDRPRAA